MRRLCVGFFKDTQPYFIAFSHHTLLGCVNFSRLCFQGIFFSVTFDITPAAFQWHCGMYLGYIFRFIILSKKKFLCEPPLCYSKKPLVHVTGWPKSQCYSTLLRTHLFDNKIQDGILHLVHTQNQTCSSTALWFIFISIHSSTQQAHHLWPGFYEVTECHGLYL